MTRLLARLRVIATAAPTWLAAISAAAPFIADDIAHQLPDSWARPTARVVLTIGGLATAAIQTIRRLTPVPPSQRGVLSPGGGD